MGHPTHSTVYAEVCGGRFTKRTLVAITVPAVGIREKFKAIEAWKESTPGLTYFSLKEGAR